MSDTLLLQGGRVIDPASGIDRVADVLVESGQIAALDPRTLAATSTKIDCRGLVVAPGFIDLHVHLREPGQEYKEDLASGSRAAAAGGFTTVCCMPNTQPVNDSRSVTEFIVRRAADTAVVKIRPIGAISAGSKGEGLADIADMKEAGIVAISDDGRPVMNAGLMRRALEYARTFNLPVVQHAEDLNLASGGVMNEGPPATRAGLRGQPWAAESVMVARDIDLVALTGARYHVAHISTAAAVEAVRQAKKRGLPVTCEVTPHHLTLADVACCGYDTNTKCAPPLRSERDIDALKAGLADGTIDCIATDHAPHAVHEKELEFATAAFGMVGLETALGLCMKLVDEKVLTLPELVKKLTSNPARIFDLPAGTIAPGSDADIVVFDPTRKWKVEPRVLKSKSKNTPFLGWELTGRVIVTLVDGSIVHDNR